jgi:hypothetical protein
MDITSAPGMPEPAEIHTMAVYDRKTGAIVHQHHVVRFKGAPKRSKKALEARAIELARSQTGFEGPLAVFHAKPDAFDRPGRYTIDLKTKKLRAQSMPGSVNSAVLRRG